MNNTLRDAVTTITDSFGADGQIKSIKINFSPTGGTYITVEKTQRIFIPRTE